MGSAWWQCTACLRTQEEDICELQLNHCNLYDVPPDVFIYERTLEKLYLDANRVSVFSAALVIMRCLVKYTLRLLHTYIFSSLR